MKAIVAMDPDGVIGNGNAIPWHIPGDFKWFKEVTTGGILLMGRKTFESIGKPLPGRETWCLSRSPQTYQHPRYRQFQTVQQLPHTNVWLCGGANLYEQLVPQCSEVYVSHIRKRYHGDAHFPGHLLSQFPIREHGLSHDEFFVVRYSKLDRPHS